MSPLRPDALGAAAIRALTGDPQLELPTHELGDFRSYRGVADGIALRQLHTDARLHRALSPDDPVARLVFDMLEQFRVESLVPAGFPGVAANLAERHREWSRGLHHSGVTESARGLLLYTVAQVCRSRVTGEPVPAEAEELIEATRFAVGPRLGGPMAGLRAHRDDQAVFGEHALAVARIVSELSGPVPEPRADRVRDRLAFVLDHSNADGASATSAGGQREPSSNASYRAFTTAYDRERRITRQVRPALLSEYRQRLDQRIVQHGIGIGPLARSLRNRLAVRGPDGWAGGQEEGRIDAARLSQLVASPSERRVFRSERHAPMADCVVSLLVDCSGSMKQHIEPVAVIVDVLARAAELAGASSEVLGFTTGAWNGGRAARDWRRAGRPRDPGRLAELSHLVVKDAETPYRRARAGIAALQKTDLFREGLDGEAVAWACRRLRQHPVRRRLLLVVSDGSPMDTATALANGPSYVDDHLRDVVAATERAGDVELYGLGVGVDLSDTYRRSLVIDLADGPTTRVLHDIVRLIASS